MRLSGERFVAPDVSADGKVDDAMWEVLGVDRTRHIVSKRREISIFVGSISDFVNSVVRASTLSSCSVAVTEFVAGGDDC